MMEDVLCPKISVCLPIWSLDLAIDTSRFVVRASIPLLHSTHPAIDPELTPSDASIAEAAARAGFDCSDWYVFRITL